MYNRKSNPLLAMGLAGALLFFPFTSLAVQEENPVPCTEGTTLELSYGDHTTGCEVTPTADMDNFVFTGTTGETIRIIIASHSYYFDPRIELRDPAGTLIDDAYCNASSLSTCSFTMDDSLTLSGDYTITVSDRESDNSGEYTLQLEKIFPTVEPESLAYDACISDEIAPYTDHDFFILNADPNTQIRLAITSHSTYFDPRIELRDSAGILIDDAYCDSSSLTTCSFTMDASPTISEDYTITVSDMYSNNSGEYTLCLGCTWGTCLNPSVTRYFKDVTTLADINDSGYPELAALLKRNGNNVATVKDSEDQTYLGVYTFFGDNHTPLGIVSLSDMNGNVVDELAVLAVNKDNGWAKVKILDGATKETLNVLYFFDNDWQAKSVTVLPDMNMNGVDELAVLAKRKSDGRVVTTIRDALTKEKLNQVVFQP